MKTFFFSAFLLVSSLPSFSQFVARMEIKEPIEGICDDKNVYALFPTLKGQEQASCGLTDQEMIDQLNEKISFLKSNPKYKDKGMVSFLINCEGKVVQCEMDNSTKSEILDQELEDFFKTLTDWKVGKLDGNPVDSVVLFSFEIKRGKFVR